MSTSPASYPVGSRVILQNLTKGTEFNGKIGVIKSKISEERQQVLLIQSGKMLGIKPINLKYEPRSVNSLTVSELKTLLALKEVTQLSGYDKSQLREMVKIKIESEEDIASLLYTHLEKENEQKAKAAASAGSRNPGASQAEAIANMTPDQLRQQARMMRSMPPSQIRRMNPQMAGLTDAQIQMAANQMEMMANNPAMLKQMSEQVKNMSPEEVERARNMQAGGGGAGAAGGAGAGAAQAPGGDQMRSGMQNMANMSSEQLKQQAQMMKSMDKNTLRTMNPAMANWSDAQIDMSINQMESMANNPDMMKMMSEQMKNMKPEELERMRKMAADGFGGDAGMGGAGAGGAGGMGGLGGLKNPMDILNADPSQIKQMLNMVKDNPQLMKDMLRTSNPEMADKMTDEQIENTIGAFANMDESKIGYALKLIGWMQEFKKSSKAKVAVFLILSMFVFVIGMLVYLVRSQKALDAVGDSGVEADVVPPVPVMEDSEF